MDRGGERGQSVVVGSLLVFTILVLSFSAYQAFAVPSQNAEVEADHFQNTESQFSQLRSNVINSVGTDAVRSTAVRLGARYPNRMLALNPPPARGQLETTAPGDVEFTTTTEDVCRTGGTPTTRSLVYDPSYNEYRAPETIGYGSRIISRQFESGALYDQRLVTSGSGNDEISLYLLTGDVSASGVDAYSLAVNGSERHTTTLTSPTIVLPSRFDADTWNAEIVDNRGDVSAASASGERVTLDFTGGTYDVSCAVVGLGSDPAFTPPADGGGEDPPDEEDSGGGYGTGSETDYSSDEDTQTVSVRNGKWNGLTAVDEIILSGGESIFETGDNTRERFEYSVTFRNTETGGNYTVRYVYTKQPGNSPTEKVVFNPQDNNENTLVGVPYDGTFENITDSTRPYGGVDLLDATTYDYNDGADVSDAIAAVKALESENTEVITSEIRGRTDVTIREEALVTAVQPDPSGDDDLTFVRLHFETATDTTGWQLRDDEGESTILPSATLSGDVYFAVDETAFEDERGLDDDTVYALDTTVEDDGDALELVDSQGRLRDEMAYNGETTTKGAWGIDAIDEGTVAVRNQSNTDYYDNDTQGDWKRVDQSNFFGSATRPRVAFVPGDQQNNILTVDNTSSVTNVTVGPQIGILGPMADLTGDGTDEIPFVDGNNRLAYADSDGSITVLAYDNNDQRVNPKKQPIGVGTRAGDDEASVYYVNGSNYLYRVADGENPTLVEPDLLNGSGNAGTFKPTGVAGLADFDGEGDEEVIVFNQSAIAYLDETGGSTAVEVVDLGTRPPPDFNERQLSQGIGKPVTYDGAVQVPIVDGGVIALVDESGDVTPVHNPTPTRASGNNKALGKPIAPRDWDGDGTLEIVYINGQPTTGAPQKSLTLIEIDAGSDQSKVRTVYGQVVKEKGVG
ncbi:hypothetical protein [Natronomonas marina]|jgi:hypothetical protein|uniref:hypothetical protein n=1 Tax=Natronomonas marina TaxID=2961939 RepID=UPI0020CA09BC|nr:hypothetical protein [Natronomonas marina]